MLKLTGFPLPDIGILTLTALAGETDPARVTGAQLDQIADYLERFYSAGIGKSLAAGVVFPNSGFVQSEFDKPQFQHKRRAWADFVLRGHQHLDLEPILQALDKKEYRAMVLRGVEGAPRCAFTGEPAYLRVSRDMLPMLNGRGVMNFSARGEAGLPVSDIVLLAIHALPFGCIITQGALLAVESDNADLMFEFVKTHLEKNRRFINLAQQNGYEKFPNLSFYKTHLIDELVQAFRTLEQQQEDFRFPSLNAYHFSNNGTSARVTVYSLPSSTVQFVWEAGKDEYGAAWRGIVASGQMRDKPESEELKQKTPKLTYRNLVYEDLFDLPENAHTFLRTYFLRRTLRQLKRDPRATYSLFTESDLLSWGLTQLFLKRIMNMDKERINQLRILGDRLAEYIQQHDQRKLLNSLYRERWYSTFRMALLRAIRDHARDVSPEQGPLVSFDGYIKIFEEGDELERFDWNLARDLLLIRIFEQLHQSGYLSEVARDLQPPESTDVIND